MSRRGDDEGFHPHPGDPWHPGWASRDEAEPEAEPEAEREPEPGAGADEAGPGEPVPAPGSRRRHFGRGRRREHLGAGATEGPSGDETGRPGLDDALPAGWWAPGAALDETTWEGRAATAPDDAGDEDGEEEEAAPSAPLFPWWGAGAAPEAPTVAAVRPVSIGEALDEEPAAPGEEPGAASLVPLDLPARPAVLPAEAEIEEEGREARLDLGEEPDAAGVAADLDRAVAALLAEMGEESVVESLEESAAGEAEVGLPDLPWVVEGPGAEPGYLPEVGVPEEGSAAGGGELPEVGLPDLPWVVEGPGAEPGYLPEVGVPEEGSAAGGGELPQVGLPDLPWVVEGARGLSRVICRRWGCRRRGRPRGVGSCRRWAAGLPWVVEDPGAEPGYLPEVGVPEEGSAAGGGELPEEGLAAPSWAPDVPPALEGEDVGFEPSGLVLASWEPAVDEFAAGTAASGAEPLPAVSEGPSGDSGMPTPEAEVDEWLAFVEGMPVGTTPAPLRAAPSPIPPAGIPDFDFEVEAVPPAAERQRPGGWFGRRRRRGTSGEEGWPERAWAAESAEAAEGDHQPPPWPAGAAAALPQEAVAAPESDEEAEAEAAFATWQSGDSAGAPEAEAAPSSAARPGPAWAEPEADQGDAARGEDWALPGPAGAVPLAPGEGGASAEEEAEEAWEEAEWTGEPEAAAGWPAEVDEDEVEVPSASLPEEEWETGDELTPAAPEGSPCWPGSAPQAPEVVSEAEWAEAGWEVFPEPGEPLPPETGALPGGREPLTAQPAEVVDELEAAGWETFPEPGRRPPRRPEEEAGGKPGSPVEPAPSFAGPAEPVFPEPYPARTGAEPTMESPPPDVFDFASPAPATPDQRGDPFRGGDHGASGPGRGGGRRRHCRDRTAGPVGADAGTGVGRGRLRRRGPPQQRRRDGRPDALRPPGARGDRHGARRPAPRLAVGRGRVLRRVRGAAGDARPR